VEDKKRQIREAQMAAEIAIEEQRALLMDQKVANKRKDADSSVYAMEVKLLHLALWTGNR